MSPSSPILPVHSLLEARLYLMVTGCDACDGPVLIGAATCQAGVLTVPTTCRKCGASRDVQFDVAGLSLDREGATPLPEPDGDAAINPTDQPSGAIDVGGWLTLYGILLEQARSMADRVTARRRRIVAGRCLEEALKFYEEGNELPPVGAFRRDTSRRQFRDRPELFARQRLIEQRAALPMPHTGPVTGGKPRHGWSRRQS